ncbi:heterokaryon incompatibility protein-domain-containing protein, partial [Diaporthe sp. PMI_573]
MSLLQYSEFSYDPLPTPTSIRLLRLHNTRNGVLPSLCGYPILHCSLHVVDLASESAPAYEALSYTWDSPETEYQKRKADNWKDPYGPLCKWPVAVRNGNTGELAVLHVRKNLFDALLHLQGMNNELRDFNGGDLEIERRHAPFNKTALIEASEEGKLARVRRLIRRGANLSATDDFGETGLHYAAENGHYEVVKELVRAGSGMDIVDDHGRTPIECCTQQKRGQWEEVAKFLRDRSFRQQELSLSVAAGEEEGAVSGFFWVDAICINQNDLEERSAQVQVMPQIYSKASCVIVWLGDDSQMIFRLLRNVWETPDLKNVIRRVNKKAKRLKELKEQYTNLDWDMPEDGIFTINDIRLILSTFLRSWFTRVWCIQELSLATKIRMFMGKTELEWHEVLKFLCLLAHLGFFRPSSVWKMDKGWTTQDGKGGDGSEAWRLAEIRLRTARNNEEWDIVDPILHRKGCEAPCVRKADRCEYMSLPLLIAATWSFESKDPRDKIYAIMSLAAPLAPEDKITVDYTSPVEDLYTQVAHIFIRGSGRDSMYNRGEGLAGILEPLEGLSYVQDPYYSGQQAKMPELPSWVPDFSNPLTTNRIWRRSFRAAKTIEPVFGPGEGKGNLHVLGAEIDVVEAVE